MIRFRIVIFFLILNYYSGLICAQKKAETKTAVATMATIERDSVMVHLNSYATQLKLNEAFQKQLNAEYDMKKLEFETRLKAFAEEQAKMPENQKLAKQQELQKMDGELQTFAKEAQQKLVKKEQELSTPLNEKITKAIEIVAQKYGYSHITEKKNFYYAATAFDVTKLVTEEANKL